MKLILILCFFGLASNILLSQSVVLGAVEIRLGDNKEKIEKSYSNFFEIKKNNNVFSIYQDNQVIGYITFDKDTVTSISKIWANKRINSSDKDRFDALFNLLNQNKPDLFYAVIQLQDIKEPNIDYQAIHIVQ